MSLSSQLLLCHFLSNRLTQPSFPNQLYHIHYSFVHVLLDLLFAFVLAIPSRRYCVSPERLGSKPRLIPVRFQKKLDPRRKRFYRRRTDLSLCCQTESVWIFLLGRSDKRINYQEWVRGTDSLPSLIIYDANANISWKRTDCILFYSRYISPYCMYALQTLGLHSQILKRKRHNFT